MNAREYFDKFGAQGCKRVAEAAGTNWPYFKQFVYGVRCPSALLARRLVEASVRLTPAPEDRLDLEGLLYPGQVPTTALAARKARSKPQPAARRGA